MDLYSHTVDIYNKIASKYTDLYFGDLSDAPYIDEFLAGLPTKSTVLDAGCGAGQYSGYMHGKGFDIVGIDMSEEMLTIARRRVPEIAFATMDIGKLTFPANHFNGILSAYSLIHIPEAGVVPVLTGFYNVLKTGGALLIIAQKGDPDHYISEPLCPGEQTFYNFFTFERLNKHLSSAGFKNVFQKEVPSVSAYSLSDTILYVIAKKS